MPRPAAALALAFLLSGTADGWANAQERSSDSPKVDPKVLQTLENEAWVEIFVALRETPGHGRSPWTCQPCGRRIRGTCCQGSPTTTTMVIPPWAPLGGTDASDDPAAWDTDGDAVRDGFECANGFDPTDPTSKPNVQQYGGTGDTGDDALLDAWENCRWGTRLAVVDTDGDALGDCVEAADVDGNGVADFVGDTIYYAKAALLPPAVFGKDGDFDIDGNNVINFVGDVIQEAEFGLVPGLCRQEYALDAVPKRWRLRGRVAGAMSLRQGRGEALLLRVRLPARESSP